MLKNYNNSNNSKKTWLKKSRLFRFIIVINVNFVNIYLDVLLILKEIINNLSLKKLIYKISNWKNMQCSFITYVKNIFFHQICNIY